MTMKKTQLELIDKGLDKRRALEEAWLHLTRYELPELARCNKTDWPIHLDHCFQRVLLDNACGGIWYDYISKRPAYAHAPNHILEAAIRLGEAVTSGRADLSAMNQRSLAWRGKR